MGLSVDPFTIKEVKRLGDLNIELMETLIHIGHHIFKYAEGHDILLLDNGDVLINLLKHACKVIGEINEEVALPLSFKHRSGAPLDSIEPITEMDLKASLRAYG
ncbi:MAG: hypothetical protein QXK12_04345 [Candidatus Nezhaarchaeales archaeon]